MSKQNAAWLKKPEKQDYSNALEYLSLTNPVKRAEKLVRALHKAETVERQAKDLLRASGLPLLPRENPHVDDDLKKLHKGKPLSPVLLVRGDTLKGIPLTVADGYHRICAIYYHDESAPLPCRIANNER